MPRVVDSSSSDESSDDEGSSSSNSRRDNLTANFVDLEAEESEDEENEYEESDGGSNDGEWATFTCFMKLPPELRVRIWELFCPDLRAPFRLLPFRFEPATFTTRSKYGYKSTGKVFVVIKELTLADQTKALRRLLAIHGESRALGLSRFPDTLSIEDEDFGECFVPSSKERDIVMITNTGFRAPGNAHHLLPGFADNVVNFAIPCHKWFPLELPIEKFQNLRKVYCCHTAVRDYLKPSDLLWTVSDHVHQYVIEMDDRSSEISEVWHELAIVPDVERYPDYFRRQPSRIFTERQSVIRETLRSRGVEAWPMVRFQDEDEISRWEKLKGLKDVMFEKLAPENDDSDSENEGPSWDVWSDTDDDSGDDVDEYESEGIDDSEILEIEDSDDSLNIHYPIEFGVPLGHPSVPISFGFSEPFFASPQPPPPLDHPFSDYDSSDSSTVEESTRVPGLGPEETNTPAQTASPRRRLKRKLVVSSDSDSDGSSSSEPQPKRIRANQAIVSDSDDDDVEPSMPAGEQRTARNRARAIVDSDLESDDAVGGVTIAPKTNGRTASSRASSSSPDASESDSDVADTTTRPSLAQRLQLNRGRRGVSRSSDGGENSSEQDDSEGSDEDEDEDEDSEEGNELLDGMAAESEDNSDEDEEDEGW